MDLLINNTYNFVWAIRQKNPDGSTSPYDLTGKDLTIVIEQNDVRRLEISHPSVSNNVASFTWQGKDQHVPGPFRIILIENDGKDNMYSVDTVEPFRLVRTSIEIRGRRAPMGITATTIELASTISAYPDQAIPDTIARVAWVNGQLAHYYEKGSMDDLLSRKVDKIPGKGLSSNDYTNEEKQKLEGIEAGADVNIIEGIQKNGSDLTPNNSKKVNITVPTQLSELDSDSSHRLVTDEEKNAYSAKYNKPQTGIPASDLASGVIPDVSQFITKSVDDLVNYYLKSDTYTKAEVQQLIAAIKRFTYQSVAELPTASASTMGIIYLVPSSDPQAQNIKDEFITIDNGSEAQTRYTWEQIGSTAIDLSGYVTTTALNTALANYTTTADLTTLLSGKADKSEMSVTDGTGADADKTTIQLKSGTSATVLKSHQDISGKEDKSNKSTSWSATPSDSKYPSEKLVYDSLSLKENSSNKVTSISASSTDTQYPSAKAVYDALYENVLISLGVNSAGTASDLIGLKVTVTNEDTSEQISEQTWNGTPLVVRIKAGVRYTVSVQTHPDYVTPASQTFTSELASTRSVGFIYAYSAVIDLSYRDTDGTKKMVQDTANSYVARVAGDYKLPAVYGNAIKNGATNSAAYTRQGSTYTADFVNYKGVQITSPYIETDTGETIASAVLLWQTGANLISNVAFANGYVTFTVNSIPTENGLAVLAVKDGNGDIMWSWTIWLTTDTLTAEKFTNYTEVDYYLMPENIFCIWNEQRTNYGTGMIQWGRKDVMVPNTPGSSSQMTVYDIDGNTITPGTSLGSVIGVFGTENDQNADKTVANSIKNPGMFFTRYDSTNNNWNNLAWFNNFWNAAETSSASSADNQDTAIKTIYDPCPFGWMLPAGRAFTGFTTTGGGTSTASQFNVVGSWSNGWNFKRNSEDTAGNKFVASGSRASGSGAFAGVGSGGYYWSFAPDSQASARDLYFYSGVVGPQSYGHRSSGFAVRPSRE